MHKLIRAVYIIFLLTVFCYPCEGAYSADRTFPEKNWLYQRNPSAPIPLKNDMPLYLLFLNMTPDKAETLPKGKFSFFPNYAISNIIIDKVTTPSELYIVQIDTEVHRFSCDLRYGLRDDMELGVEIPYIRLSRGTLDGFIESFEDFFNFTTPGARERADDYDFNYRIAYNYNYMVSESAPRGGLGDMVFSFKYRMRDEDEEWPRLALKASIKAPTGSDSKLLGSGGVDFGLSLLVDKNWADKLFLYLNLNAIYVQKPDIFTYFDMDEYILSGMFAAEYFFTDRFSTTLQLSSNTSPYPGDSGTDPLDNEALMLLLAFAYDFGGPKWHISVTENVFTDSSPDVSFETGAGFKF